MLLLPCPPPKVKKKKKTQTSSPLALAPLYLRLPKMCRQTCEIPQTCSRLTCLTVFLDVLSKEEFSGGSYKPGSLSLSALCHNSATISMPCRHIFFLPPTFPSSITSPPPLAPFLLMPLLRNYLAVLSLATPLPLPASSPITPRPHII